MKNNLKVLDTSGSWTLLGMLIHLMISHIAFGINSQCFMSYVPS